MDFLFQTPFIESRFYPRFGYRNRGYYSSHPVVRYRYNQMLHPYDLIDAAFDSYVEDEVPYYVDRHRRLVDPNETKSKNHEMQVDESNDNNTNCCNKNCSMTIPENTPSMKKLRGVSDLDVDLSKFDTDSVSVKIEKHSGGSYLNVSALKEEHSEDGTYRGRYSFKKVFPISDDVKVDMVHPEIVDGRLKIRIDREKQQKIEDTDRSSKKNTDKNDADVNNNNNNDNGTEKIETDVPIKCASSSRL